MEISNKTLAWLVVATILVSTIGTFTSLNKINGITGLATSNTSGNVSVSIASQTSLTFAIANLNFGSGSINGAYINCTLFVNATFNATINTTPGCIGFQNTSSLVLENNGNTVLNVTLNFSSNATSFIGGTSSGGPVFRFIVYNNESSSCSSLNISLRENFTDVTPALVNTTTSICTGLSWQNANDSIGIGVYLVIPADSSGTKLMSIVAQGTG